MTTRLPVAKVWRGLNRSDVLMAFLDAANPDETFVQHEELFDEFGPGTVPGADAPVELPPAPELSAPHPAEVRLAELEKELREVRDWSTRIAADFENYKKRIERERQDQMRFSNEKLLREFLPIFDNMMRALDASVRNGEAPSLTAGIELVLSEMTKTLRRAGVEPITAVGKVFDPAIHEALQQVETDAVEPGYVVQEIQPGYSLSGRVLRPTLVTVAVAPEVTTPGVLLTDLD